MTWPEEQYRALMADACKRNFWTFVRYGFGVARNPRGRWLTARVHKPLCDTLQRKAKAWLKRRRRGIQGREKFAVVIPRGFGKTVICTKAFPAWLQLQDPDLAIVVDSESSTKSEKFLAPIKTMYEGGDPYSLFTWLYGTWFDPNRKWRDTEFVHACRTQMALTEPSFQTASVETGATGFHPDMLVLDDPISADRIREQGNWVQIAVKHANNLIPALRTDSFFLLVGTPYTNDDVINTLLEQDGVSEAHGMKMPEILPQPSGRGQFTAYFLQARDSDGESTLPEAWTTDELDDYERKKPLDFAAQMMCTPGTGKHMPLIQDQIDDMWVSRETAPRMVYSLHFDTAFKDKNRLAQGDESVIEMWGHDMAGTGIVVFMEGHGSNDWQVKDFTECLLSIVQRYRKLGRRIKVMTDEKLVADRGDLWESHLQGVFNDAGMHMPRFIRISRAGTKKEVRIREAAAFWADGSVKLMKGAPGVHKLVRQMLQIGVSPHDDWADAGADVFHPDVYIPALPGDADEEVEEPWGPFDEYLKTGQMTDDLARRFYDQVMEDEEGAVGHIAAS